MRHPVKAVHFQLTGRCNLACSFCGQNKGMLGTGREELPVGFWLRCAEETEPDAPVTFWGGEPLLYPGFEELAERLAAFEPKTKELSGYLKRYAALVSSGAKGGVLN